MRPQLNYNTGDFISASEVVLLIPKNEELSRIKVGLLTIPGKPIPFSTTHPIGGFKDKNINTVFYQGIKSAGTMGDAYIDSTSRPKLKAKIYINDPDIEALIKQDKVALSYAYWGDPSHNSFFEFDHLLLFTRKGACE